ncbi:hypothetical protein DICSQDRAFT_155625 [Dichomitus squalens LYAD-421 SS1]|uniref:Uncharacterized protein n=1 Tax=Dichomitus squalens (strain LYAD-421) TaxID=732165 RepID=R7SXR1_DICSQ|nr:uncharacterized protein DICSQDRAFT_155625 [Dichomitus squalens LYAD-421 SS1]EJF60713.1 hypothetical protein DICSQDRAFT_155625 [Dichomitus squalens LYAD-421 SS1]
MSTASPSAFSLWSILAILFLVFLVHHLWCYDRFKCLRWSAGRQPGAFKRIMTYSYLGAVPLLLVYSIGMTVIKVREGYVLAPDGTFIPMPINAYRDGNRSWVLPLQFVFSFAWALEMVTHLEELAFWLYLLHQNPNKEAWFSSWEYRFWYIGSICAIVGMPLTALITRNNLETCDAYIFLVGSAGSTSTTVMFLYVLWRFPMFIKHVKGEGADPSVVVRLATFYQLNQVRVVFRFLFTIPLLILALDGIIGTQHPIDRDLFVTDFLQMLAGLGCFVSSMITLLIFFPRSIVRESGYKPKVSSTILHSPKSSPVTPPSRSGPFAAEVPAHMNLHRLPAHMVGYASPSAFRMSTTGVTGMTGYTTTGYADSAHTQSVYSPRESLQDSRQYAQYSPPRPGEEGADVQRWGTRVSRSSRRGVSRRASVYSGRMDAHPERGSDGEYEGEDELRRGVEGNEQRDREDEESAPPYSHAQLNAHTHAHARSRSHPQPHGQGDQQTQAHLHLRLPFVHSHSNPQIDPAAHQGLPAPLGLDEPPSPPRPGPPPAIHASSTDTSTVPPSPTKAKRRTWDWEERRAAPTSQVHGRRDSLHIIANGPGATAVNLGPGGARVGLGLGVNVNLDLTSGGDRSGRRRSSLHPYVVNFTSPIDLVDLPPTHHDLPRAI